MQFDIAFGVSDYRELGRDVVFLVGDAVRVEAFHDVLDAVGKRNRLLLDDLKVFNLDY